MSDTAIRSRSASPFMRACRLVLRQKYLLLLLLPAIIWFFLMAYVPMGGILMAFQDFDPAAGYLGGSWAGLKYFRQFINSHYFSDVMRNTLGISGLKLLFGFPAPILFSLLFNELWGLRFKRFVQTASYLPYFVSWVVVVGILQRFLTADDGLINLLLVRLGMLEEPISFLSNSKYIWGVAVISEIWKNIGWNSIIYLAALTSISPELYEAARIDGASRLQQVWHITLPCIKPTIAIMLVMAVGGIFSANFDQLYLLGTPPVLDVTEVIDTYVYRTGLKGMQFSLGASVGLMKSVISFVLVLLTNGAMKLLGEEGLW